DTTAIADGQFLAAAMVGGGWTAELRRECAGGLSIRGELRRSHTPRRQPGRDPDRAAQPLRAQREPEDGTPARREDPAAGDAAGRPRDRRRLAFQLRGRPVKVDVSAG